MQRKPASSVSINKVASRRNGQQSVWLALGRMALALLKKRRTNMRRVGLEAAIGIGLFIAVGLLNAEPGYAGEPTCTLKTLKGRYLFALNGTLLPPAFGVTQPTLSAASGFHIFNGDGTGTDIVTFRLGGVTVLENAAAPVIYEVNEDCTGSFTVTNGPSFSIFIAPDGESFAEISTAPQGNQVSDIARRVSHH